MKVFSLSLVTLCLGLACAGAASETPAAEEAGKSETPPLELKHRSSFELGESGRNPFWPIGWKPAAKANAAANPNDHSGPDISPEAFVVSSITVDASGRYAIINGKVMSEGQVFGLQLGNQTFQMTVKAIEDGQVVLGRRDEEIAVPLHRR